MRHPASTTGVLLGISNRNKLPGPPPSMFDVSGHGINPFLYEISALWE